LDLAVSTICLKYSPASGDFALQLARQAVGALVMRLNGTKSDLESPYAAEEQVATSQVARLGIAAAVIAQPIISS
jgi:hypothetical protein